MTRPTRAQFAAAANVEPRQVNRDQRHGAPRDSVEEYLAWRAANIREYTGGPNSRTAAQAGARSAGRRSAYSIGEETARLRRAQAEQHELENAETRSKLVNAEDVMQLLLLIGGVIKAQLEAQPGRMANELAAVTDPAIIRSKLLADNRRTLEACHAEVERFAEKISEAPESDGSNAQALTGPDTGPVGGHNADPAAGLSRAGTVP